MGRGNWGEEKYGNDERGSFSVEDQEAREDVGRKGMVVGPDAFLDVSLFAMSDIFSWGDAWGSHDHGIANSVLYEFQKMKFDRSSGFISDKMERNLSHGWRNSYSDSLLPFL